ncbi:MAG: hypothetical protein ABSA82_04505 [Thermacetogeniaceae bacterium]|jgi:tetratricopeptide (TPR) repeat protein
MWVSVVPSHALTIVLIDRALRLAPEYIQAHKNKGLALQSLGDMYSERNQLTAAEECYNLAKFEFNEVCRILERGSHDEALESYGQAVKANRGKKT